VDPVVQTFLAARLQLHSSSFLLSIKNINSMLAHRFACTSSGVALHISYIIVLGNEKNTEKTFIISVKCKRITKSVFVSEIYAIAYGVDIAIAIRTIIDKITDRLRLPKASVIVCTNFLSLYECLIKLETINKKRLIIDIMALRQTYERQKVFNIR
jgi:hypothetical protein